MPLTNDERLMRLCTALAMRGEMTVEPNPLVGSVVVREGRVIARGWHTRFGGPHAEVNALRKAGANAQGASLYVNLEPCSHHGKTPPCTGAIIQAGISEVVIGMEDPNPVVSGRGVATLEEAGVRCRIGILEQECRQLNARFYINMTRRRPFVMLKIAQTLDGFIAAENGASKWITSEESRKVVHELRSRVDAVAVGAGTVREDNPHLTVRHAPGKHPVRVVFSSSLDLPDRSHLFRPGGPRTIVLTTSEAMKRRARFVEALQECGLEVLSLSRRGPVRIEKALGQLFDLNVFSLLVEGGAGLFSSFLRAGLVDRMHLFIAPAIIGSGKSAFDGIPPRKLSNAHRLRTSSHTVSGGDIHLITNCWE